MPRYEAKCDEKLKQPVQTAAFNASKLSFVKNHCRKIYKLMYYFENIITDIIISIYINSHEL